MIRAVAGALDDPFRVAELDREDIARLPDEAASLSLTGGRRVVRVREVDRCRRHRRRAGAAGRAGAGAGGDRGRPACRTRARCAPCWRPRRTGPRSPATRRRGAALTETIRHAAGGGAGAGSTARRWPGWRRSLAPTAPPPRRRWRSWRCMPGRAGRSTLQAAMTCVGDLAGLSLDDALFAATDGDVRDGRPGAGTGDRRRRRPRSG